MHITSGGLYILDDTMVDITVDTHDDVALVDTDATNHTSRKIRTIGKGTCTVYACIRGNLTYEILGACTGIGSTLLMRYMLIGSENTPMDVSVLSQLSASQTTTNVHILSTVSDGATIQLDGTVQIDAGITEASGHILEENIFLGSKGKVKGVPSLLVRSNDVAAGHAARIERVPDEKLYYLRARGIPKDDATVMMLRSSIAEVFAGLADYDIDLYEDIIETALRSAIGERS